MKFWTLVLVSAMIFTSLNADAARRMGGGRSMGQQSSNVTQREAGGGAGMASPAQKAAAPAAAPPAAAAPKRPWGAMLGGLAAGLGLAWLAHSLGLGEAFGQFIMVVLLVMVGMMVVGFIMRSLKSGQLTNAAKGRMNHDGLALQGEGAGAAAAGLPRSYNPGNVGNDASARPWERNTASFESSRFGADAGGASLMGAGLRGSQQAWGVPADFDVAGFLGAAKANFVNLQNAWDRSDIPALRAMMTDAMLDEIKSQLAERESHRGAQQSNTSNTTDVMVLEAQLLGIEDTGQDYMASVEFSGLIREEPSAGPNAFREVWNMTKPKAGGGWLVAGVQALQ